MEIKPNYTYDAELSRVVDGDTVRLSVSMGFYTHTEQNFRLVGIDTPEIRGEERQFGLIVKNYVEEMFYLSDYKCRIVSKKHGKYRWLADIYLDHNGDGTYDFHLNQELLNKGYAKEYLK